MTYNNNIINNYHQLNLNIENPTKLILMLYEGILRFSHFAKKYIEKNDIENKTKYINKTIDIFIELINSLNFKKGGEIAYYLNGLYDYQIKLLIKANIENNPKYIEEVIHVVKELIKAWKITNNI